MTIGVRAAVENEAGQVCLVRHTYVKGWYMPGGGVERGEPAIEALRRELQEEAGIGLTAPPQLFGVYSNQHTFPNDHVLFYRVPWGAWAPAKATQMGEIAEIIWADPKAPPDGITKGNLLRLKEVYGGAEISPFWSVPHS